MDSTYDVDRKASRRGRVVVSTRYPQDRRKLLEAIQARRGDDHLSDTVAYALDRVVEEHFPGAVKEAA